LVKNVLNWKGTCVLYATFDDKQSHASSQPQLGAALAAPRTTATSFNLPMMTIPHLGGIGLLAPRYDGFILDLWGVVHDGIAPLPGAIDCMRRLIHAGKCIALLSNAPRRADDVARRIGQIGIPADCYHHIMSSGEEAWQHLRRRNDPFYVALGRRCLHLCSDRDLEIREGLDLEFVDRPERADFILNTGPSGWNDTIEDYAPLLRQSLQRSLPMICANPDLVVMHGGKPALCAGALAEWYETKGGRVRWHGKPHRSVYDSCLALLGVRDRSRILCIGDSLRTDIAGAAAAGLDSLLITGGIHAEEFGAVAERDPDPALIDAALAAGPYHPIAIARYLCW
jgi:HAD superfamily hydrolase (TIGR01459 family)